MPTSSGLGAFLGRTVTPEQGAAVLEVVTAMARAYTRNVGFDEDGEPNEEIGAVILSCSARLIAPSPNAQLDVSESHGPSSVRVSGSPVGFSVTELMVLNRYRQRSM